MDKHTIKLKQEGHSNRKISKLMGINRKTVTKYWDEFNDQMSQLTKPEADIALIQEQIATASKYNTSSRVRRKYTEEIDQYLDLILQNEKNKDSILGNHKQKLTNSQIYKKIKDAGFDIGLACISNHIKIKRDKAKECFIKQEYDFGDRLEYDFGEVKIVIDGKVNNCNLAVFSSPAADFRWAYLYKSQKNDVFMDSHVRFFEMLGGVYKEIVYDNMRNVVTKFIGKNEKSLNPNLLILSNYYGFHINVTNCFSGNEKGHVEGRVKIIRNSVFAPRYEFDSFDQAQDPQVIPKGLLIAMPLIAASYILPTMGGLASVGQWENWATEAGAGTVGYMDVLTRFLGPGFGILFLIVAIVSQCSIFNTDGKPFRYAHFMKFWYERERE